MGNQNKIADTIKADEVAKISFAKNLGRSDTFYSIKDSCLSLSSDEIHEIVDRYYNPKIPQPLNAKITPKSENLPKRKSGKTWLVALGIIAATALLGEFVYYNRPGRNSTSVQQQVQPLSQGGYVQQMPKTQSTQEQTPKESQNLEAIVGMKEWAISNKSGIAFMVANSENIKITEYDKSVFRKDNCLSSGQDFSFLKNAEYYVRVLSVSVKSSGTNSADISPVNFKIEAFGEYFSSLFSDRDETLCKMIGSSPNLVQAGPYSERTFKLAFLTGTNVEHAHGWLVPSNYSWMLIYEGDPNTKVNVGSP